MKWDARSAQINLEQVLEPRVLSSLERSFSFKLLTVDPTDKNASTLDDKAQNTLIIALKNSIVQFSYSHITKELLCKGELPLNIRPDESIKLGKIFTYQSANQALFAYLTDHGFQVLSLTEQRNLFERTTSDE